MASRDAWPIGSRRTALDRANGRRAMMSERPRTSDPGRPPARSTSQLDEDDRLKPEFVRAVLDAVEAGDAEGARALVEPLHPGRHRRSVRAGRPRRAPRARRGDHRPARRRRVRRDERLCPRGADRRARAAPGRRHRRRARDRRRGRDHRGHGGGRPARRAPRARPRRSRRDRGSAVLSRRNPPAA